MPKDIYNNVHDYPLFILYMNKIKVQDGILIKRQQRQQVDSLSSSIVYE
jgi:hypothetical protein